MKHHEELLPRIREAMRERDLGYEEVAESCGMSAAEVRAILEEKRMKDDAKLSAIARAAGIQEESLGEKKKPVAASGRTIIAGQSRSKRPAPAPRKSKPAEEGEVFRELSVFVPQGPRRWTRQAPVELGARNPIPMPRRKT